MFSRAYNTVANKIKLVKLATLLYVQVLNSEKNVESVEDKAAVIAFIASPDNWGATKRQSQK